MRLSDSIDVGLREHLIYRDKHHVELRVLMQAESLRLSCGGIAPAAASPKVDKILRINLIAEYSRMKSFYDNKHDVYMRLLVRSKLQLARFTVWVKSGSNGVPSSPQANQVSSDLQQVLRLRDKLSRHIISMHQTGFHVRPPGGVKELDDGLHRLVVAQKFVCNATVAILRGCHLVAEYRRLQQSVCADTKDKEEIVEEDVTCPISFELFRDPVRASDGRTYERADITEWFANNDSSPWTGLPVSDKKLRPDKQMRRQVQDFKKRL